MTKSCAKMIRQCRITDHVRKLKHAIAQFLTLLEPA